MVIRLRSVLCPVMLAASVVVQVGPSIHRQLGGQPILAQSVPGYSLAGADGGVFTFGGPSRQRFFGSSANERSVSPVSSVTSQGGFGGLYVAHAKGKVDPLGDKDFGGGQHQVNAPVVAIQYFSANAGDGYWLATANGGVYTFGAAKFFGSLAGRSIDGSVVGMAASFGGGDGPDGYLLVTNRGRVYAFGGAVWQGDLASEHPTAPVVAIADGTNRAYWLATADGHVYAYGPVLSYGDMAGRPLAAPIVAIVSYLGWGYWLVGADGGVFSFGQAQYYGSMGGKHLTAPIVGAAFSSAQAQCSGAAC